MESRAMQAALELSMLNLNNTSYSMTSPEPPYGLLADEVPIGSKPKSQNITQCVAVPSSEHVAEIVGRQGELSVRLVMANVVSILANIWLSIVLLGSRWLHENF